MTCGNTKLDPTMSLELEHIAHAADAPDIIQVRKVDLQDLLHDLTLWRELSRHHEERARVK